MAYFPYKLMPLTPKQTPQNADPTSNRIRITAEQYNMHDEEILALEQYIGTYDKTGHLRRVTGTTDINTIAGVMGNLANLVEQINMICVDGITLSSGYAQCGQVITFPENATVTYLSDNISKTDSSIGVFSTAGFPQKGVLSIINDVRQGIYNNDGTWSSTTPLGTSNVEWIKYDGKTPKTFLNCQRGYLGTTSGTHTGEIENFGTPKSGERNFQDQCMSIPSLDSQICQYRYQGWRNTFMYSCPIIGIYGTQEYIEDYIRLQPSAIRIMPGTPAASIFIATASQLNILGTRSDGSVYLSSADGNYRSLEQLSPKEAYSWIQLAIQKNIVQLKKKPSDLLWPDGAVPVFSGKLGVQFAIAALNGSSKIGSVGPFSFIAACSSLGADGTVYCYLNNLRDGTHSQSLDSMIHYETTLIPNVRTLEERTP
jgi:hypothetical protein